MSVSTTGPAASIRSPPKPAPQPMANVPGDMLWALRQFHFSLQYVPDYYPTLSQEESMSGPCDKHPIPIVSACMKRDGRPAFVFSIVEVTEDEAENGIQFYLVE